MRDLGADRDVNVLLLAKAPADCLPGQPPEGTGERYLFLWTDERAGEVLRVLGRFASNPDLSFTWYDAAVLSAKVRKSRQPPARWP